MLLLTFSILSVDILNIKTTNEWAKKTITRWEFNNSLVFIVIVLVYN